MAICVLLHPLCCGVLSCWPHGQGKPLGQYLLSDLEAEMSIPPKSVMISGIKRTGTPLLSSPLFFWTGQFIDVTNRAVWGREFFEWMPDGAQIHYGHDGVFSEPLSCCFPLSFDLCLAHSRNEAFCSCRICGCGSGESGCAVCGCCKACARELDGQEARQRGILDAVKEMIPLDLLLGKQAQLGTRVAFTKPSGEKLSVVPKRFS